jgi:hypothetical protein
MIVEPLPFDFNAALASFQRSRSGDRTAGVHLSTVIKFYMQKIEPERFSGDADLALFQTGFLWEDVNSWAFSRQMRKKKRCKRCGCSEAHGPQNSQLEVELDDILMTPDEFNTKIWRIGETKATKMSRRHPLTSNKFWHWMVQIKGYCNYFNATEAELKVLWVNGSYELAGGRFGKTVATGHLLKFTPRELKENWELVVLRSRDRMLKDKAWCREHGVAA